MFSSKTSDHWSPLNSVSNVVDIKVVVGIEKGYWPRRFGLGRTQSGISIIMKPLQHTGIRKKLRWNGVILRRNTRMCYHTVPLEEHERPLACNWLVHHINSMRTLARQLNSPCLVAGLVGLQHFFMIGWFKWSLRIAQSQCVGGGWGVFLRCNYGFGSVSTWIIPSFVIWGYVLGAWHISCVITNKSQHEWVIPFFPNSSLGLAYKKIALPIFRRFHKKCCSSKLISLYCIISPYFLLVELLL